MITGYEIVNKNGEDILYIYYDLSDEFSRKYFSKKQQSLKDNINDFIKKSKIAFIGTTAAVFIGGAYVGNIYLDRPYKANLNAPVAVTEYVQNKPVVEIENIVEDFSKEEIVETENYAIKEENVNTKNIKLNINDIANVTNNVNENINNQQSIETPITNNELSNESSNIFDINKTYVSVQRRSGVIEVIELEDYVTGVVAAEMPAEFHIEALKAQSVIARTYALKALSKGKILSDTESTQTYKDTLELKSLWGNNFDKYYNKVSEAVKSTSNMKLLYNGQYIEAVYHSTSNGYTENAINVWGYSFPYLITVESPYDSYNKSFIKDIKISYDELSKKLNMDIGNYTTFVITERTESGRVKELFVYDICFTGIQFRNLLGLRSTDFEIIKEEDGILFKTKGYGHGVGMSQYGANGMASNGYDYIQILNHYYPGTFITN